MTGPRAQFLDMGNEAVLTDGRLQLVAASVHVRKARAEGISVDGKKDGAFDYFSEDIITTNGQWSGDAT